MRRRNGRRYTAAAFTDIRCVKSKRVDGISYHYCDGRWYERVFENGEVIWIEVVNPG